MNDFLRFVSDVSVLVICQNHFRLLGETSIHLTLVIPILFVWQRCSMSLATTYFSCIQNCLRKSVTDVVQSRTQYNIAFSRAIHFLSFRSHCLYSPHNKSTSLTTLFSRSLSWRFAFKPYDSVWMWLLVLLMPIVVTARFPSPPVFTSTQHYPPICYLPPGLFSFLYAESCVE